MWRCSPNPHLSYRLPIDARCLGQHTNSVRNRAHSVAQAPRPSTPAPLTSIAPHRRGRASMVNFVLVSEASLPFAESVKKWSSRPRSRRCRYLSQTGHLHIRAWRVEAIPPRPRTPPNITPPKYLLCICCFPKHGAMFSLCAGKNVRRTNINFASIFANMLKKLQIAKN